ncbi:hypothetical protein NE237_010121 [Protea cynaroides]|uniref:Dirigent protein n=1 Tax=Protea cynaroides TaxID=273540 RepID=A0A9Q0KZY4_9MAGN|nr:hypothetical protein NE237_010121 [Protea cynaroides]
MRKHPSLLKLKLNLMAWFLLATITIVNQSTSARILDDLSSDRQHLITFFMRNAQPSTPTFNDKLPFPNPATIFPPINPGGTRSEIPIPESYSKPYMTGMQSSLSFPAVETATLQGLDLGAVTPIEEDLMEALEIGLPFISMGRAKGAYVASSDDGSNYMMAMTARFADGEEGGESKDSLRFFGVHRTDVYESHISVIGGTGKYEDANGYATVKAVTLGSRDDSTTTTTIATLTLFQFTVYLTY